MRVLVDEESLHGSPLLLVRLPDLELVFGRLLASTLSPTNAKLDTSGATVERVPLPEKNTASAGPPSNRLCNGCSPTLVGRMWSHSDSASAAGKLRTKIVVVHTDNNVLAVVLSTDVITNDGILDFESRTRVGHQIASRSSKKTSSRLRIARKRAPPGRLIRLIRIPPRGSAAA